MYICLHRSEGSIEMIIASMLLFLVVIGVYIYIKRKNKKIMEIYII